MSINQNKLLIYLFSLIIYNENYYLQYLYLIVPASKTYSSTFNSADSDNGSGTFSINLSNYVTKNNPVIENDTYLKTGVKINMDGTLQEKAFSAEQEAKVDLSRDKLVNTVFANNETKITGNLNLAESTLSKKQEIKKFLFLLVIVNK